MGRFGVLNFAKRNGGTAAGSVNNSDSCGGSGDDHDGDGDGPGNGGVSGNGSSDAEALQFGGHVQDYQIYR